MVTERESHLRVFRGMYYEGENVAEWTRDSRNIVSGFTVGKRLKEGWDPVVAITTPLQKSSRNGTIKL